MNNKFELTSKMKRFKTTDGRIIALYRICALKTFHIVKLINGERTITTIKKGSIGGWVEKEANLDQRHGAWIDDNAVVVGEARVTDDAWVGDHAIVQDRAHVSGCAKIGGYSRISDSVKVSDTVVVHGHTKLNDQVKVGGDTHLCDAYIGSNIQIINNHIV